MAYDTGHGFGCRKDFYTNAVSSGLQHIRTTPGPTGQWTWLGIATRRFDAFGGLIST